MTERLARLTSTTQFGADNEGAVFFEWLDANNEPQVLWVEFADERMYLDVLETISRAGQHHIGHRQEAMARAASAARVVANHLGVDDECGGGDFPPHLEVVEAR